MPVSASYRPAQRIHELGEDLYDIVDPAKFPSRTLRFRNQRWAERVGLGELDPDEWERHFAVFKPLPENLAKPLALRYHGHQFAVYNPALGDGRGFLFAQLFERDDSALSLGASRPRLLDLGTKGSGQTPWSRGGDGRLTLKGGVREVLATEMLEALGVNTSKTWSLFETGEPLYRNDEPSPARSSVLVRLSHSHIRFGTFQRFAYLGREASLRKLLDYCVEVYMPEIGGGSDEAKAAALLAEVARQTGALCASYMIAGFVHGVLNTDNMNITGESFDYGPYRFLPIYDPAFTAAYFDHTGLYAFGKQPRGFLWNLMRLADALRPCSPGVPFEPAARAFERALRAGMQRGLLHRLGLSANGTDMDGALLEACYDFMGESRVGYDQFFFDWYGGVASEARALGGPAKPLYTGPRFEALRRLLDLYTPSHEERLDDPYFKRERPESLLIDEIEAIWDAIATRDDWAPFNAKVESIRAMGALYAEGAPAAPPTSTPA